MVDIEWEVGDFALIDNLAVGHYASPGASHLQCFAQTGRWSLTPQSMLRVSLC